MSTQQATWKIAPQHYLMPCELVTGRTCWVKSNRVEKMIDVISYKFNDSAPNQSAQC